MLRNSKNIISTISAEDHNQHIQEFLLLQRVAQRINSILDIDLLLEEVVSDVSQTFGYSRSAILFKDNETDEMVIAAVRGWTMNFHVKGDRFKIGAYGIVGHVGETEELYYAPDVTKDPYYQISEESTRSELDIPLKVYGRLIGIFNFQHQQTNAFSGSRIQILEALAGHLATAIENARLFTRERQEKERISKELAEAQKVQFSLLPGKSPAIPDIEISGVCIPCGEVGGDWYDYINLRDGCWAVVLADVSGKGMPAALLMASTRSIVRMFAGKGLSPARVLEQTNRVLIQDYPKNRFVTMIYAQINPKDHKITFVNAGHLPPFIFNEDNSRLLKLEAGLPLGIKEMTFNEFQLDLSAGTRILLYSDGISEAKNALSEEYELSRIREHMKNNKATLQSLLEDVRRFSADSPVNDDMTMVMIKT